MFKIYSALQRRLLREHLENDPVILYSFYRLCVKLKEISWEIKTICDIIFTRKRSKNWQSQVFFRCPDRQFTLTGILIKHESDALRIPEQNSPLFKEELCQTTQGNPAKSLSTTLTRSQDQLFPKQTEGWRKESSL